MTFVWFSLSNMSTWRWEVWLWYIEKLDINCLQLLPSRIVIYSPMPWIKAAGWHLYPFTITEYGRSDLYKFCAHLSKRLALRNSPPSYGQAQLLSWRIRDIYRGPLATPTNPPELWSSPENNIQANMRRTTHLNLDQIANPRNGELREMLLFYTHTYGYKHL